MDGMDGMADWTDWLTWENAGKVAAVGVAPIAAPFVAYSWYSQSADDAALKAQQQAEGEAARKAFQKAIEDQKKRMDAQKGLFGTLFGPSGAPGAPGVPGGPDWQKLAIVGGVVLVGLYLLRKK
jgi:hypothetical protein